MTHPITDFKAIYPEYFNKILNEYKEEIKKYKNGSKVCLCGFIIPIQERCSNCYGEIEMRECLYCSERFESKHSYRNKKFCNLDCESKYQELMRNNTCTGCGREFNRPQSWSRSINKFCNQRCYRKYRRLLINLSQG